jgi:hypothetical protein
MTAKPSSSVCSKYSWSQERAKKVDRRTFLKRESTRTHMNSWNDFLDGFLLTDIMVQIILVTLRLLKTGPKAPSHHWENRKRSG